MPPNRVPPPLPCPEWCVVEHDGDDASPRVHHSAGRGIDVRALTRARGDDHPSSDLTRLEIGVTRSDDSGLDWVLVEDGADQHLALSLESALLVADLMRAAVDTAARGGARAPDRGGQ